MENKMTALRYDDLQIHASRAKNALRLYKPKPVTQRKDWWTELFFALVALICIFVIPLVGQKINLNEYVIFMIGCVGVVAVIVGTKVAGMNSRTLEEDEKAWKYEQLREHEIPIGEIMELRRKLIEERDALDRKITALNVPI